MKIDDIKIGAAVKIEDGKNKAWYARVHGYRQRLGGAGKIELKVRQFIFGKDRHGRLIFKEDGREVTTRAESVTDCSRSDYHLSAAPPEYAGETVNIPSRGGGSSVAGSSGAAGSGPPAPAPAESAEERAAAQKRMDQTIRRQAQGKLARRAPLRVRQREAGDDDGPDAEQPGDDDGPDAEQPVDDDRPRWGNTPLRVGPTYTVATGGGSTRRSRRAGKPRRRSKLRKSKRGKSKRRKCKNRRKPKRRTKQSE